jgi:hypothetical protein
MKVFVLVAALAAGAGAAGNEAHDRYQEARVAAASTVQGHQRGFWVLPSVIGNPAIGDTVPILAQAFESVTNTQRAAQFSFRSDDTTAVKVVRQLTDSTALIVPRTGTPTKVWAEIVRLK